MAKARKLTPEEIQALGQLDPSPDATPAGKFVAGTEEAGRNIARETVADLKENWPRYAGATVGSIIAGPEIIPAIIGASVGGAGGKLAQIEYEKRFKGIHPKGFSGLPNAPEYIREMEEVFLAGGLSAAEEAGGRALLAAANPLIRRIVPFKSKLTPEGKLAWETVEKYMPAAKRHQTFSRVLNLRQPPFLPSEITDARILDLADNIASNAWVGGGRIADYKKVRAEALGEVVDDLGRRFGEQMSEDDLGELIVQNIQGKWKGFRDTVTAPLFNTVEEFAAPEIIRIPVTETVETGILDAAGNPIMKTMVKGYREVARGGARVNIAPIKAWLKDNHKKRVADALKGIPGEAEAGHNLVSTIMHLPDNVDYIIAKELRTQMRVVSDTFSVANKKAKAIGVANKLEGMLTEQITQGLEKFDPNLAAMWTDANAIYKSGGKQYNSRFLRSLIDQVENRNESSKVVNMIWQRGNTNRVKALKNAVDPATFEKVKAWLIHQKLAEAIPKGSNLPSGSTLWQKLYGPSGMGKNVMKEAFTPDELHAIDGVIAALQVAQARQAEGQGSMLVQFLQAGSVGALVSGKWQKIAWPVLALPEIWARVITNPYASRALTQALLVPDPAPAILLRVSNAFERAYEEVKGERYKKRIKFIERIQGKIGMPTVGALPEIPFNAD